MTFLLGQGPSVDDIDVPVGLPVESGVDGDRGGVCLVGHQPGVAEPLRSCQVDDRADERARRRSAIL